MSTREDRIAGVMLGMAAGDALGVPYELGGRVPASGPVMSGGGYGFSPGEWSDDTQQAICVLNGRSDPDKVAAELLAWYKSGPADVGPTSSRTLSAASRVTGTDPLALVMTSEAKRARRNSADGQISNGSLMRTGPACLPFLGDRAKVAEAARDISNLTHYDKLAGDACVLWSLAIEQAIEGWTGDVGALVSAGLAKLPAERRDDWQLIIKRATHPKDISPPSSNLNVVKAFEAALWAVAHAEDLSDGLVKAIRIGGDTDTIAAIAGALLGAIHGAKAVPSEWRKQLHGWPDEMQAIDLERSALAASRAQGG